MIFLGERKISLQLIHVMNLRLVEHVKTNNLHEDFQSKKKGGLYLCVMAI